MDEHEEILETILEQWAHYRTTEEWLVLEIVKARGTSRSTLKRMLKETRKMLKNIESQLFNG